MILIDDDADFRHGLAENLRDDGYEVHEYGAPAELPPLHELAAVDLVIVDYSMPGENGLAFAQRFHDACPSIPVLLVTADGSPALERQVAASGFLHLRYKPIGYSEIRQTIDVLTNHPGTGRVSNEYAVGQQRRARPRS